MNHWLIKSEPGTWSWDQQVEKGAKGEAWTGVRNHTAKQNLAKMKQGDRAFFYHSGEGKEIVGICEVIREAYPDFTQFDPKSDYYDATSNPERPKWKMVDVGFVEKFDEIISLEELRKRPELAGMTLLSRGRLSVQPVEERYWNAILKRRGTG